MGRKFRWIVSTEKEQEWRLYFLRNKIVLFYAGEEEENLPFLLRFCLNQTRGCARIDITSGKYLLWLDFTLLFTPVSITPLIDTEDACFDLNASRPIAKGDLKWRDALLVAHRVSSNDFTEDSRRSVLHERERGYAYADRS